MSAFGVCVLFLIAGAALYTITVKQQMALNEEKRVLSGSDAGDVVEIKQRVQHLSPQIAQIESYFIDEGNAPGFIARLEAIAAQASVAMSIEQIEVMHDTEDEKKAATYGEMALGLRAEGSWQGVMTFLATIEQLDKKLIIEGLRLSATAGTESGQTGWVAIFTIYGLTQ